MTTLTHNSYFPSVLPFFASPAQPLGFILGAVALVDVDAGKEEGEREHDEAVELELVRVQLGADDRDEDVARQVRVLLDHVVEVLQDAKSENGPVNAVKIQ